LSRAFSLDVRSGAIRVTVRRVAATGVLAVSAACGSANESALPAHAPYLAARDSAEESILLRFKEGGTPSVEVDSAFRRLTALLAPVVGPFRATGFADSGRINLTTLFPESDYGLLDGMRYEGDSGRRVVVVTTRPLVEAWLRDTARSRSRVSDPVEALRNAEIYGGIFGGNAMVFHYADLPVAEPVKRGVIAAMLVLQAQDTGPFTPDRVVVAVSRGSRVFVAGVRAQTIVPPTPRCLAVRDSVLRLSKAEVETYLRSVNAPPSPLRSLDPVDYEADVQYRRCYSEAITRDPSFSTIVTQASRLASSLPMR
jgi:hypothetical protein